MMERRERAVRAILLSMADKQIPVSPDALRILAENLHVEEEG